MRTRNCETAYSVSNIIAKRRHGLATDCHHLPMVPMVPIVPQSAPMVSVADVSVKLYCRFIWVRYGRNKQLILRPLLLAYFIYAPIIGLPAYPLSFKLVS